VETAMVIHVGKRLANPMEFVAVTTRWMNAKESADWTEAYVRGANAFTYNGVKAKVKAKHFGKIAEMQRLAHT